MLPFILLGSILLYLGILYYYSHHINTTTKSTVAQQDFMSGGRVRWWAVSIGMLGTSLSGVTFISVPGLVATEGKMTYFQFVLGNFVGILIIALLLLPLYYRMSLYSIYVYIGKRFGKVSHQTAARLFIVSRIIGSSFRLYLGCLVVQILVFNPLGIPFWINGSLMVICLWLYTRKGGIKTLIWTDFIQTLILLGVAIYTFIMLLSLLGFSASELIQQISHHPQFQLFSFDKFVSNPHHFAKQFLAGIFITIALSGLDQDMMQKNLKLRTVTEARKNFLSFGGLFVFVNFFFLLLGFLFVLFLTKQQIPIPEKTDTIYTLIMQTHLGTVGTILFVVGVMAATFSSCASTLVSLTTSFLIDIKQKSIDTIIAGKYIKTTRSVHTIVALFYLTILLLFHTINDDSIVNAVFKFAGYTYGPLLSLFVVGMFTNITVKDKLIPWVAIFSIVLTIAIDYHSTKLLNGYKFGFEILLVNAGLSIIGFLLCSRPKPKEPHEAN